MRLSRVRATHAVLVWLTALAAVLSLPTVVRQPDLGNCVDGDSCLCAGVRLPGVGYTSACMLDGHDPTGNAIELNV